MSSTPDDATQALQRVFAAHLRDPANTPAPADVEPRRMAIYTELFFNNIQNLVAANFPVIRSLHDDAGWQALLRAFYRDHRCHTPLFTELAREFIRYVEERRDSGAADPPFLVELAHYEFEELAVSLDETDIADLPHDPRGDVVDGIPCPSPIARMLAYRFPVHRIGPDFRPDEPPDRPTLILLTRDRQDELHFIEIDPLTALLFDRLSSNTASSGREVLEALLVDLGRDEPAVRETGLETLNDRREREALLGTRLA